MAGLLFESANIAVFTVRCCVSGYFIGAILSHDKVLNVYIYLVCTQFLWAPLEGDVIVESRVM